MSGRCPYRQEMIHRSRTVHQQQRPQPQRPQPAQSTQPAKSAWVSSQSTYSLRNQPSNQFQMLSQVPPMDEFPDTLQATGSMGVRIPEGTNNISHPDVPAVQIARTRHVPQAQTPQKKRQHSGAWRQIVRKPTNQPQSPPTSRPQAREHIEQPHPEPLPSTSRLTHTTNLQAPITRSMNKECQMSVKDIVATSQLIMTMQQHLMAQMAEIQPNVYIHNIMKAISESMHEITAKYESCIGMPKA